MNRLWTLTLVSALTSQAAALTAGAGEDSVVLQIDDRLLAAQLRSDQLTGPDVRLTRQPQRIFGELSSSVADLEWDGSGVRGLLGSRPVFVELRQQGLGFEAVGHVGSQPVSFRGSPTRILGEVAGCEYTLVVAGEEYRGWRDCGGTPVPASTTLRLPEALKDASDAEAAALLILFLHEQPFPGTPPPPGGETLQNPGG